MTDLNKRAHEEVKLRQFKPEDASSMQELANNEKVARNLRDAFPHPYTLEDAKGFIDHVKDQDPPLVFAISYNDTYVGNIGLGPSEDVYRRSAEIGYFIGEPYWNKGIATKAVKLITEYGFSTLNLVRIHTGIFEFNPASMRVLEKGGFEKEAIFKASISKMGKIWNEHRYALIHPDYR
jgi:RimJ/RimL family protein N-acetyltransferase